MSRSAAVGAGQFGTGSASIRSTQDLQLISGLPPLVRVGDQFRALFTLRNTTARKMQVVVTPNVAALGLAAQTVELAPESSREIVWDVNTPDAIGMAATGALNWEVSAAEQGGPKAADAIKLTQRVVAAIPVTVQQATITQVDGTFALPVAPPETAVASADGQIRGGIAVTLQPKLADGLPGVRRWFERYPYSCLEQQTSRALGLNDLAQWQTVIARMPSYLDSDGLANYFPPADDSRPYGSPTLSAYLLAVSDEASKADRRFALPDDLRDKLAAALTNFVEGKIQRKFWSPRQDLDFVKLSAIEALSRYGLAEPRMLGSITIAPNQWPTSAVLDYYAILSRVDGIPQRDDQRAQVEQILRARLTYSGTRLTFSTAADDDLYWLMTEPRIERGTHRLAFADNPAWKDEMPRLVGGLLALQKNGAWQTTTSNLWGKLAVERFSRVFESTPVSGQTRIALGSDGESCRVGRTGFTGDESAQRDLALGVGHAEPDAGRHRQTVGDHRKPRGRRVEGAVRGGLSDHENRHADRSGRQRHALARRYRARASGHRCAKRHDLGGRRTIRCPPARRFSARASAAIRKRRPKAKRVRKARGRRLSNAVSMAIARITTICRRGNCRWSTRSAEQRRHVRAAAHARRGAVCAVHVRRASERAGGRRAVGIGEITP